MLEDYRARLAELRQEIRKKAESTAMQTSIAVDAHDLEQLIREKETEINRLNEKLAHLGDRLDAQQIAIDLIEKPLNETTDKALIALSLLLKALAPSITPEQKDRRIRSAIQNLNWVLEKMTKAAWE